MSKPWLKQPGECHDKRGIPIYPGDLLKVYHYRQAKRRQKRYLYFVAIFDAEVGAMRMIPVDHLEPTIRDDKAHQVGMCLLNDKHARGIDVISGTGPEALMDYDERPRKAREEA